MRLMCTPVNYDYSRLPAQSLSSSLNFASTTACSNHPIRHTISFVIYTQKSRPLTPRLLLAIFLRSPHPTPQKIKHKTQQNMLVHTLKDEKVCPSIKRLNNLIHHREPLIHLHRPTLQPPRALLLSIYKDHGNIIYGDWTAAPEAVA